MKTMPRWQTLDIARGWAVIAMISFHLIWDLAHFGYIAENIAWAQPFKAFGHTIAFSFLFIAGISLTLAHDPKIHWRTYLRHLALISASAALVSIGTYVAFPSAYVFFGILHCIATASVIALGLVIFPWPLALSAALFFLLLPFFFSSPMFNADLWQWLGLSTREPMTQDWRPLFPWAAPLFFGVAAAKSFIKPKTNKSGTSGPIAFLGRHSLMVYLLHQPLIFTVLSNLGPTTR